MIQESGFKERFQKTDRSLSVSDSVPYFHVPQEQPSDATIIICIHQSDNKRPVHWNIQLPCNCWNDGGACCMLLQGLHVWRPDAGLFLDCEAVNAGQSSYLRGEMRNAGQANGCKGNMTRM